jgi:hypothetical protein
MSTNSFTQRARFEEREAEGGSTTRGGSFGVDESEPRRNAGLLGDRTVCASDASTLTDADRVSVVRRTSHRKRGLAPSASCDEHGVTMRQPSISL